MNRPALRILGLILAATLWNGLIPAHAELLPSGAWSVSDSLGDVLKAVTDNSVDTVAVIEGSELGELSVLIDLHATNVLHGLCLSGGRDSGKVPAMPSMDLKMETEPVTPAPYPKALRIYVGPTPETKNLAASATIRKRPGNEVRFDAEVRFQPLAGRYVRLVATDEATGLRWMLAELELFGFTNAAALSKQDAVVQPVSAASPVHPLSIAARDLSYYLGELTGRAVPVIRPDKADQYPGIRYHVMDLKPLASTYEEMVKHRASGDLPDGVNVERKDRDVFFRAWPYENVLRSAWEFLRRQGVVWASPGLRGDFIPSGKGVNLDILPLKYTPSSQRRLANFDTQQFTHMDWDDGLPTEPYLFWWRNGYNETWGGHQRSALGGSEVPPDPRATATPKESAAAADYAEGFDGYPHNFNTVVPDRILEKHPEWCGMYRDEKDVPSWVKAKVGPDKIGKRLRTGLGGPTFCLSNPDVIQFVADKAIYCAGGAESTKFFRLLPMDCAVFCQCDECLKRMDPKADNAGAWVTMSAKSASDIYYYFVAEVAKRVQLACPTVRFGALAYADCFRPPDKIDRLPDNVVVEVCQYGAPGLPMDAPQNAAMKAAMEAWARKSHLLQHYDYVLLNENKKSSRMPLPLVAGISDRLHFLHSIGALDGGTQADNESVPYRPWNAYVYPRLMWDIRQTADSLLEEFFGAYFREAKDPMLAYYRTIEKNMVSNHLDYRSGYSCAVHPGMFTVPLLVTMGDHLATAAKQTTYWVTAERVARTREGYDSVLQTLGLTGVNLRDDTAFPVVRAGQPMSLHARKMPVRKDFVEPRGEDVIFFAQGELATHVRFEKTGTFAITLAAAGVPSEDIWPELHVLVNGKEIGTVTVKDGEFKDYTLTAPVLEGIWQMQFVFRNASTDGRRNLMLKTVTVEQK